MTGILHRDRPSLPFTAYLTAFLCFFAASVDDYLGNLGLIPFSLLFLFFGSAALYGLFLLVPRCMSELLARWLVLLRANAAPLGCFLLWFVGHILYLPGQVFDTNGDADYSKYIPLYPLVVLLFALALAAHPSCRSARRPACTAAMVLLGTTVVYDAMFPGTFSPHAGRAAGLGIDPNISGFTLVMLLTMAVGYRSSLLDFSTIAFGMVTVTLTLSRGGFVLWSVFMLIYLVQANSGPRLARLAVPTLLLVVGLGAALYFLGDLVGSLPIFKFSGAADRLGELQLRGAGGDTDDSRLQLFLFYARHVLQSPIIGYGTGFGVGDTPDALFGQGPHNMYLRVWTSHGIWGLATYLGFLLSALGIFRRNRFAPGIAFMAIVLVHGLFSHTIVESKAFLLLFGLALGLAHGTAPRPALAARDPDPAPSNFGRASS